MAWEEFVPLEHPDFKPLREMVIAYVAYCHDQAEYCDDNDWGHFIFEEAVKAVYGEDVWSKLNEVVG